MALAAGIGAAIGGLFKGASSAASAMIDYETAKKLQQHQYDLNQRSLRESPSASREGYVNAGYNPLLPLGSPGMGFSANSSGINSDIDVTSGLQTGINSAIAIQQAGANLENIRSDTTLKEQQASTEQARQINIQFQNAMLDVQKHLAQKDLDSYDRRFYSNLYEQFQRAENYRANSAVSMFNAQTQRMNAYTNKMNAETNQKNSAISEYNAMTQRYKNNYSAKGASFGASWSRYDNPYERSYGNSGRTLYGYVSN